MNELKNKTVCVFDSGNYTPLAERLTKEFGKVLYFSPWENQGFPESKYNMVGTGIKGVTRIESIWSHINEIDLFVFTDCYYVAEQEYLKSIGKLVWGSGKTSWLERDKKAFYEWIDKEEMPIPETNFETGVRNLAKNIKKDEFIKISNYRGDLETLKFYDKTRSDFRLKELELSLQPFDKTYETIRQQKIDGIEIGGDYYTVDGELPKNVMFGVECKDSYYFGRITPYAMLPKQVRYIDSHLQKVFKNEKTRTHFSHEMRIEKNGDPFFTDFTARLPNPPYQLHLDMIANLGEIMYFGSQGIMKEPRYLAKYGVVAIFKSETVEKFNLPIKIDDKVKDSVKIMNLAMVNGESVALSINRFDECGAVTGIGNTLEEARKNCEKNAEGVKADGLVIDVPTEEDLRKKIQELREFRIPF